MLLFIILILVSCETQAKIDSHKCLEISTFGYSYDAVYKISSHKSPTDNQTTRITFYVKAKSDAHILFSNSPRVIEQIGSIASGVSQVAEILLGGGQNTFSEIRIGTSSRRSSVTYLKTPNIVSAEEFRGFWIDLQLDGSYGVGLANNKTPILFLNPNSQDLQASQATYFGVSTWNHVKGSWKFNCENETEVNRTEDVGYKGSQKLRRDLLSFYDPNTFPVLSNDQPTDLVLNNAQIQQFRMDEKGQSAFLSGQVTFKWKDQRLTWETEQYDNFTSLLIPASEMWTPDFNSLKGTEIQMDLQYSSVRVENDGSATWSPTFKITQHCNLKINDWPRDEYKCPIHFAFTTNNEATKLIVNEADFLHNIYSVASEWEIREITTSEFQRENYKTGLTVDITFARKSFAYINIFSGPLLASSIMMLASFWLRHESGVKMHLRCISMLVLTVFFVAIGETIPAATSSVPTIVYFYITGIMLASCSIIHYAITKNISQLENELPGWIASILSNSLIHTFFFLPEIPDNTGAKRKRAWILTAVIFERLFFLTYLAIYAILWTGIELF